MIRVSSHWTDRENDVRGRLRSYRALVSKHHACKLLYETLFPRCTPTLTDEPRGGTHEFTELERVVQQRLDLRTQMDQSLQKMRDDADSIMQMVNALPPDECTLIMHWYMRAESMETISELTFISVRQCWNIHERAIRRMAKDCSDLQ